MKRIGLIALIAIAVAGGARGQEERIGDSFEKAAFVALERVKDFAYGLRAPTAVSVDVKDKLDKTAAEASTPSEVAISDSLKKLLVAKISNNIRRQSIQNEKTLQALRGKKNDPKPTPLLEDPEYVAIGKAESACFDAFETSLRARSAAVPAECVSINGK